MRQILAEKIEHLEKGEGSRLTKKIERKTAKKNSRLKKARRKYRALDDAKHGGVEGGEERGEGKEEDPDGLEDESKAADEVGGWETLGEQPCKGS